MRTLAAFLLCLLFPLAVFAEEAAYSGVIGTRMTVHADARENSGSLGRVEKGTRVDVYSKGRTWTRIGFGDRIGYVKTKYVELVQRKNPFDGPMPGTSKHTYLAKASKTFRFTPEGYRYPTVVKEGTLMSVHRVKDDKAYFPYRKLTDDISVSTDKLELTEFVPWEDAQPGDLLYAFTTFYPTSEKKEGNTGRMFNIGLAAERLTNIVIPAGGSFSFNGICGPYTLENGYQEAPILAGESSMGVGGGVCQVCSTIYNIFLRLPFVIEDMNWHSQGGVSYLPSGFDATVSNTKDLVCRNVMPYDVRLEFEDSSGVMTAILYRN